MTGRMVALTSGPSEVARLHARSDPAGQMMPFAETLTLARFEPPPLPAPLAGQAQRTALLAEVLRHGVTLIEAPAGYGKTILAALWHQSAADFGVTPHWVSLAGLPNDGALARRHVIAAATGESHGNAATHSPAAVANRLSSQGPVLLVIDEADGLASGCLAVFLDALLLCAPRNLHLVVTARSQPPLATERLDEIGRLWRVGRDVLRLEPGARAAFGPDAAAALAETEGWPLAARMHAHRRIARYFETNLIARLDPAECRLLEAASLAEGCDSALAEALTPGGADMLASMAARGLFVEAIEHMGVDVWRIDPCARHHLAHRLKRNRGPEIAGIGALLAQHALARGEAPAAIRQLLAAELIDAAATLVASFGSAHLGAGNVDETLRWIAALGPVRVHADPRLGALELAARIRFPDGDARPAVDAARPAGLAAPHLPLLLALVEDNPSEGEAAARRNADSSDSAKPSNGERLVSAMAAFAHGHHDRVRMLCRHPLPDAMLDAVLLTVQARSARAQGAPRDAEHGLATGFARLAGAGPIAVVAPVLARALYERNAFDTARALVEAHAEATAELAPQDSNLDAMRVRVRLLDPATPAIPLLEHYEAMAERRGWTRLMAGCLVERARLGLTAAFSADALLASEGDADISDPASVAARTFAILAELKMLEAMQATDHDRLVEIAVRLHDHSLRANDLELRMLAALYMIVPQLSGRCERLIDLDRLLLLNAAVGQGFRRSLLDVLEVTGVGTMVELGDGMGKVDSFAGLLPFVRPGRVQAMAQQPTTSTAFLTAREIDILSALTRGVSNKEIARTLLLTPETVKWHLKNVMRKLNAGSREQAVAHAGTLGLRFGS